MNKGKIMYESRSIETEPLRREIMVHSAMYYKCKTCGTTFQIWLEKGLEDKKQDEVNPENHKPVPFCIDCLCGGIAQHIAWERDIELNDYRPLKGDENYFENTEDEDCGVSHFRNNGSAMVSKSEFPDLLELKKKMFLEREREIQKESFEPEEDNPYGLAHISTTTLKEELRRRKRWR